jgi:hypothetical protein
MSSGEGFGSSGAFLFFSSRAALMGLGGGRCREVWGCLGPQPVVLNLAFRHGGRTLIGADDGVRPDLALACQELHGRFGFLNWVESVLLGHRIFLYRLSDLIAEQVRRVTTELSPEVEYENRGVAQLGSAPDWGSGGRGFKSPLPDQDFGRLTPRRRPIEIVTDGGQKKRDPCGSLSR